MFFDRIVGLFVVVLVLIVVGTRGEGFLESGLEIGEMHRVEGGCGGRAWQVGPRVREGAALAI
jgi:hypothetical protein